MQPFKLFSPLTNFNKNHMEKSIYRETLKSAWDIAKNNKILWIFGLFAALLGNGGEYQILAQAAEKVGRDSILSPFSQLGSASFWRGIYQISVYNPIDFILSLIVVLSLLFLVGFIIWLVMTSQVALISAVYKKILKKNVNFQDEISSSKEKFVPILAINVLAKLLIGFILFLIGLPLLLLASKINSALVLFLYIIIFILLIPAAFIISFLAKYSAAYIVLKNKCLIDAIRSAWELFLKNWIISLEMAFILFLLNIVIGFAVILIITLIALPFIAMAIIYSFAGLQFAFWMVIILISVISLAIIGFTGAILSAFQWSGWIILFKRLTSKETVLSKIERSVKAFPLWVKEKAWKNF